MDPQLKAMCKVPIRIGTTSGTVSIYGEATTATPVLVYAYVQLSDREFTGFDGQLRRTSHMVIFPTGTATPTLQSRVWLDAANWTNAALARNPKAVETWREPGKKTISYWQLFV